MQISRSYGRRTSSFERPDVDLPDPQSWLAAIVHSSDDAIISKDLHGKIISWNEAAETLFGYTPAEAIGNSITIIIPPERWEEEVQILSRIRAGKRVEHVDTVRRRKDGTLVDVVLTVSPIRNSAGRIIGASKIARDISTRKQLERAQAESDRERNEFLGILAHELRNPLAPLRTSLEVLQLAEDDPAVVRKLCQIMERQVNQLTRLVEDLGDIARVSNAAFDLRLELVDIHDVLLAAVDASGPRIEDAGHRLSVESCAEPVLLVGDSARLVQVVTNLLNNAARYTDPGGTIVLRTMVEGGQVRIVVKDNGIGIAPEDLPRILQMFKRTDVSRNRTREGLGVGLPLAKRLVELHGGTLTVESDGPGKGSTFTVTLPAVSEGCTLT